MYTAIRKIIEAAWENRELLKKEETRSAIDPVSYTHLTLPTNSRV